MPSTLADELGARIENACPNPQAVTQSVCPGAVDALMSEKLCREARQTISSWTGHQATPLRALPGLARQTGISAIYYKDESLRFGLGSFKALGGSYAVLKTVAEEIAQHDGNSCDLDALMAGRLSDRAGKITVVTATDGNHGRSVAWGAQNFGCRCIIYMHAEVSEGRQAAVERYGAQVVRVDGDYGESVRKAAEDAALNGWLIVSDTSWPGYAEIPRHVMAGYTLMSSEAMDQLSKEKPPTHVFIQGGCGGLAAAVCADLWHRYGTGRPQFIVVEPEPADCLYRSALAGRAVNITVTRESIMAGLSCGEVSLIAWPILALGADHFLTINDDPVGPLMARLAQGSAGDPRIVAGEAAVAGLAGCIAACSEPALSQALGLDHNARVLVFGTEGATDPVVYRRLVGNAANGLI